HCTQYEAADATRVPRVAGRELGHVRTGSKVERHGRSPDREPPVPIGHVWLIQIRVILIGVFY
ncbi:hypothetical protein, partial [Mesorhizobium sp. M7A.F.Ca.ET.027.02.1.1]|uniref:hypothetical protein n=1 Tax=Mesorhizobium sp. M7A.F.Ca.ET.027.02.1.1 TaxID=2496655 RepID=UPI001AECE39E